MDQKKKKQPDGRRILVGLIAIAWIVYTWAKKDLLGIYGALPKEELAPLAVTTGLVSVVKVLAMAAVIFLIKWLAGKMAKKKN